MPVKIVIVDDSVSIRRSVAEMLGEYPDLVLVGEAGCVEDGLRTIVEQKPDVVVLDIIMPGGSGLGLINPVKLLYPRCRVIMLSNHTDEWIRRQAQTYGADHFLDKTFEFEQLADVIRTSAAVLPEQ
ncbi:MAG: response regulator transcription factor [Acidobacteriota bacterium]